LILNKIIGLIVATRCQILRLKCTKFDFGWGSAPDPAGELTALPHLLDGGEEGWLLPPKDPHPPLSVLRASSPLLSVPGSFSQILALITITIRNDQSTYLL